MAAEAKDVQENTEAESAGNGAAPGVEEGAGGADGAVALAKPSGHAAKEAGALAMLDSIVKEREMDTAMVQDAMKSLMQDHEAEKKAKLAREKALRSVVVNNADIAIVAREYNLGMEEAEVKLRENNGDLKATLLFLLNAS